MCKITITGKIPRFKNKLKSNNHNIILSDLLPAVLGLLLTSHPLLKTVYFKIQKFFVFCRYRKI